MPNVNYSWRTAPLTSKRCILYIYSTNIGTEYFKHGVHSPFFSFQNAVCFIILTYLVPILFTFYIQGVLKLISNTVHELPSPLVHLLYWQTSITTMNFHSSMNFDEFHCFTIKNGRQDAVLLWCMLQAVRHLYTTTAPSCCIPASYCHLPATLQTMNIIE